MAEQKIEVRQLYENRLHLCTGMKHDHAAWKAAVKGGGWFDGLQKVGDIKVPGGPEIVRIETVISNILKENNDPAVAEKVLYLMKHFHRSWVEEVTQGNAKLDAIAKVIDAVLGSGDLAKGIKKVNEAGGSEIWGGYRKQWNVAIKKTGKWLEFVEAG